MAASPSHIAGLAVARAYHCGTDDDIREALEELYRIKREKLDHELREKLDAIDTRHRRAVVNPERDPLLWRCPDCGTNTWPRVDPDGRQVARRSATEAKKLATEALTQLTSKPGPPFAGTVPVTTGTRQWLSLLATERTTNRSTSTAPESPIRWRPPAKTSLAQCKPPVPSSRSGIGLTFASRRSRRKH